MTWCRHQLFKKTTTGRKVPHPRLGGLLLLPPIDFHSVYVYLGSMVSTLTTTTHNHLGVLAATPPLRELVRWWLAGKSSRTVAAYHADLQALAAHLGMEAVDEVVAHVFGSGPVHGMGVAASWVEAMTSAGLSPATINRRMASLRSLSKLLHAGVGWTLATPRVRSMKYRDTRGPGRDGVRRLLEVAGANPDRRKAIRDVAVIRLLHDLGLRRGEVAALQLADLDVDRGVVRVIGKGRREAETFTVPAPTLAALKEWVVHRGGEPGPLVVNVDRRTKGGGLTSNGVHHLITTLGRAAGVPVRPHGLRHAAITAALDATGGDVRRVSRFSRHRDIKTVLVYDDARTDLGGAVASLVAFDTITTMEPMASR